MQKGLVSIIMPMRNSASFVEEAILSVLSQTYKNWELLVVDDSSTDNSREIVKAYQKENSNIHLLINDNHTGIPSAPRNFGIKHANGQYIAFLDSDDCWLPTKLEEQIRVCHEIGKAAIVFSNYEKMDEYGKRNNRVVKAPSQVTFKDMLHSNYIGNLTGMYDRNIVGTRYLPNIHHEDYALWLDILKEGFTAYNTGTVEALYRIRNYSVSSNKLHISLWQWDIYRQHEHIPFLKALYYYACYAVNGWRKSRI